MGEATDQVDGRGLRKRAEGGDKDNAGADPGQGQGGAGAPEPKRCADHRAGQGQRPPGLGEDEERRPGIGARRHTA